MADETGNDGWSKQGDDIMTRLRDWAEIGTMSRLCDDAADEIERLRDLLRLFVSHDPCDVNDGECVAHGWFVDDVLRCPMAAVSDAVGGCGCD